MDKEQLSHHWETLTAKQKVLAILSAVQEPIPKVKIIELSGIHYDGLNELNKAEVDAVIDAAKVKDSRNPNEDLYQLEQKDADLSQFGHFKISHYYLSKIRRFPPNQ